MFYGVVFALIVVLVLYVHVSIWAAILAFALFVLVAVMIWQDTPRGRAKIERPGG